jgi:hypothetical protein
VQRFLEKQIEISEKLFLMMKKDFKERHQQESVLESTAVSLIHKLEERDAVISDLRARIKQLEGERFESEGT